MAFCSQCGFLLPPKVTTCPRCDGVVVPVEESEVHNTDDPTIISELDKTEQSKLERLRNASGAKSDVVQESEQVGGYNSWLQGVQDVEQGRNTPVSSSGQHTPFGGYYTPTPIPPPPPAYMEQSGSNLSTTHAGSYPDWVLPTRPDTLVSLAFPQKEKRKGNVLVMLLILLLVVIITGATTAAFIIGPDRMLQAIRGGSVSPQSTSQVPTPAVSTSIPLTPTSQVPTPTSAPTPTPTLTPDQQAQGVIDNYFTAINNKDYQTAYNLWVNYPDTYQNFANGFANTRHDEHQFGQVVTQSDGTVQVNITLIATSTLSQQTTYQGYYMVGKQADGTWKIITASLKQV